MSLLPLWIKAIILAAIVSAVAGAFAAFVHHERDIGRDEVRAEWAVKDKEREQAAFAETQTNAKETLRRLQSQQANQERQNEELKIARDAADRNARDAERVRKQASTAADQWSNTLRNSPTAADLAAAADTIRVQADLFGRADRRAGILAAYADAARAAGLKCERDYTALTVKP